MPAPRPTIRSLAAEAGVSPMTVSLALRHSRQVSAETRRRINQLAARRGYRPDPTIAKLMHHLRTGQPARFQANLCAVGARWSAGFEDPSHFLARLTTGMRGRAAALGYAFDQVELEDYPKPGQLLRVLRSRGVEGLVVLPLPQPRDITACLDWSQFATVSVTSSLLAPQFHSVTPRHYDNLLLACRELTARGRRRIGLALSRDWDVRVNHRWVGAIEWHNRHGGTEPVRPFIEPQPGPALDPGRLLQWLRREKPDVVIAESLNLPTVRTASAGLRPSARPELVTTNWCTPEPLAGIDQRIEDIGAAAIEMLAAMILHDERGVPASPNTLMVTGRWEPARGQP